MWKKFLLISRRGNRHEGIVLTYSACFAMMVIHSPKDEWGLLMENLDCENVGNGKGMERYGNCTIGMFGRATDRHCPSQ